jgi:hypothetical protein
MHKMKKKRKRTLLILSRPRSSPSTRRCRSMHALCPMPLKGVWCMSTPQHVPPDIHHFEVACMLINSTWHGRGCGHRVPTQYLKHVLGFSDRGRGLSCARTVTRGCKSCNWVVANHAHPLRTSITYSQATSNTHEQHSVRKQHWSITH